MRIARSTLRASARLSGLGLHSGRPVDVAIHPGREGIWFRHGKERVRAHPENVADTARCTRLGGISVVEHVMAAFAGMGITDAEVELSQPELPGLDGSAAPYVAALKEAGTENLGEVELRDPFSRVFAHSGDSKVAIAAGSGHWRYSFVREESWVGTQVFEASSVSESFSDEIAPARTIAFEVELPHLERLGLGRGLDRKSCVIVGPAGYGNQPRFADEPARHKLLDAIGDLYLAGVPIGLLDVAARRSGHKLNVEAAAKLAMLTR